MTQAIIRFFVMVIGNTLNSHIAFVDKLKQSWNFRQVNSVDESDFIIAFVAIASRAGTDIEAALQKIPASRPVVLVVLHHTNDQYFIAPDSRLCVKRSNVFTVDCLFHEDRGLLTCHSNNKALEAVKKHLSDGTGVMEEPRPSNYRLDKHDGSPVMEAPYSPAYLSQHNEERGGRDFQRLGAGLEKARLRDLPRLEEGTVRQCCCKYWFVFLIIGIIIIIAIVLGCVLGRRG